MTSQKDFFRGFFVAMVLYSPSMQHPASFAIGSTFLFCTPLVAVIGYAYPAAPICYAAAQFLATAGSTLTFVGGMSILEQHLKENKTSAASYTSKNSPLIKPEKNDVLPSS